MALSEQERIAIIEDERVRFETRRLLAEQARPRRGAWGRRVGLALLGLSALAFLALGCHHHRRHDPAQRAERLVQRLAKKLDLTADQESKTLALVQSLQAERARWRGEGPSLLAEIRAQFEGSHFDAQALDQALAAREKKLAASRALLVQKLAEFHAILSPEQRSKAAALLSRWEARWREHAGPAPKP